jgi:hypothetical protein
MDENNNKLLLSIMILLSTLGTQHLNTELGEIFKEYLKNPVIKFVLISCIFYAYTKNWYTSLAGSLIVTTIILHKKKEIICKRIDKN